MSLFEAMDILGREGGGGAGEEKKVALSDDFSHYSESGKFWKSFGFEDRRLGQESGISTKFQ